MSFETDTAESLAATLVGKAPGTEAEIGRRLETARMVIECCTSLVSDFVYLGADAMRARLNERAAQVGEIIAEAPGTPNPLDLMNALLDQLEGLSEG